MSRKKQPELDLGLDPLPEPASPDLAPNLDLAIKAACSRDLSPAQIEFNKRLKFLEKARAAQDRKRKRLEKDLVVCRDVLMPLVEDLNRARFHVVVGLVESTKRLKLSKRRSEDLDYLLCDRIDELFADPAGLGEEELAALEAIAKERGVLDSEDAEPTPEEQEFIREEFEELRAMLEEVARQAGVKLDLEGLDPTGDPDEFEQEMEKRLAAAGPNLRDAMKQPGSKPRRKRKPTKAALERERRKQEVEAAKKRDFKSLYKQLAKALHPDLETDPELRSHKEAWMKRLTTAHAAGDLREMLVIEMEWLGEESSNLAKASEEKLQIYALVLKEQVTEIKERTRDLFLQPEFSPLRRFISPFDDRFQVDSIRDVLTGEMKKNRELIGALEKGSAAARKAINQWLDQEVLECPF